MVKTLTIGLIFISFLSFATNKESNGGNQVLKIVDSALYKEIEEKKRGLADYKRQLNKAKQAYNKFKEAYDKAKKDQLNKKCHGLTSVFINRDSIPRHARTKQTFFVVDSLFEIAKKANKKLSSYIGITLFEIKAYKEYNGKGGKVYVANKVNHDKAMLGLARGSSADGEISKVDIVLKKEHHTKDSHSMILHTMMHEMGHALGLDHTTEDKENLMYPYNLLQKQNGQGSTISSRRLKLSNKQVSAVRCAFSLKSHNKAFEDYKKASEDYKKAIDNYNKAVKEYNEMVKGYNDKMQGLLR